MATANIFLVTTFRVCSLLLPWVDGTLKGSQGAGLRLTGFCFSPGLRNSFLCQPFLQNRLEHGCPSLLMVSVLILSCEVSCEVVLGTLEDRPQGFRARMSLSRQRTPVSMGLPHEWLGAVGPPCYWLLAGPPVGGKWPRCISHGGFGGQEGPSEAGCEYCIRGGVLLIR